MGTIPETLARDQLRSLLSEAYSGSDKPYRYFLEGTGLAEVLAHLSLVEAFTPTRQDDNTSTIAAHVSHVVFACIRFEAQLRGSEPTGRWSDSWQVVDPDQTAWDELRSLLDRQIESLHEAFGHVPLDTPVAFGRALSVVTHLAFHMGIIREKISDSRTHAAR